MPWVCVPPRPPLTCRSVPVEPLPTAIALVATGILLAASVLASRTSGRAGVPVALLFLLIGMLAGSAAGIRFRQAA